MLQCPICEVNFNKLLDFYVYNSLLQTSDIMFI